MDDAARIAPVEDIPEDGSIRFTVERADGDDSDDDRTEGILLRLDGDVVAYENFCRHWTDVRLDKGDGATIRSDEIVCENHGATFEMDTGYCNFGPCEGATLLEIDVTVAEGAVYLTDEGYEFVALGGDEDDDGPSSGRGIGFSGS